MFQTSTTLSSLTAHTMNTKEDDMTAKTTTGTENDNRPKINRTRMIQTIDIPLLVPHTTTNSHQVRRPRTAHERNPSHFHPNDLNQPVL